MLSRFFSLAFAAMLALAAMDGVEAKTAGCGKTPSLTSGTHSLTVNGKSRQYIVKVPDNYDANHAYKLIFGFHWRGGTMQDVATGQTVQRDVWSYYGLERLANDTAIFVAPQGLNNGWANSGNEDIAFVDGMIKAIEEDLCVDEKQIFATGFSYGAAMTHSLACSRANVFRAVAVLSGGALSGCNGGTNRIPYLGVHGVSDSVLPISMGRQLRDTFVRNNGCTAQNPQEPSAGSRTHTKTVYSGCTSGYPVWWIAFDGGHIAAPQDGASGDSGSRTFTPGETWKFFLQFT